MYVVSYPTPHGNRFVLRADGSCWRFRSEAEAQPIVTYLRQWQLINATIVKVS